MEIEEHSDGDNNFVEDNNYSNNLQLFHEDSLHEQESYFGNISSENYFTNQYNETERVNTYLDSSLLNYPQEMDITYRDDNLLAADEADGFYLTSLLPDPNSELIPIPLMEEELNSVNSIRCVRESKELKRPKIFKQKTCLHDNIQFSNNQSFLFDILYHISVKTGYLCDYKESHLLEYKNRINDKCLIYPVNPYNKTMIKEFEKMNNVGINIFGMKDEEEEIEILYRTSFSNHDNNNIVNLLYYERNGFSRYFYIKYLKKIVGMMNNDNNMKNKQVCANCIKIFDTALKYRRHLEMQNVM